jgi:hypothetical protein
MRSQPPYRDASDTTGDVADLAGYPAQEAHSCPPVQTSYQSVLPSPGSAAEAVPANATDTAKAATTATSAARHRFKKNCTRIPSDKAALHGRRVSLAPVRGTGLIQADRPSAPAPDAGRGAVPRPANVTFHQDRTHFVLPSRTQPEYYWQVPGVSYPQNEDLHPENAGSAPGSACGVQRLLRTAAVRGLVRGGEPSQWHCQLELAALELG